VSLLPILNKCAGVCIDARPTMNTTDDLNWDDLRYFLRAAQAQTLAGAARELGVEHSTIGRRLSSLENALGQALVLRNPDGLELTPAGERVLPLVLEVERAVLAVQNVVQGQVRIRLAVPSGMTAFFTSALARLHVAHPHLALEIVSGARPVDLHKGEADVALRMGPVSDPDLVARKLGEAGWALFASEHYLAKKPAPADIDDLTGHDVIAADPSMAAASFARWMEERAARATVILRSREMMDALAAVRSGLGLGVLPCGLGDSEPTLRRLSGVLGSGDFSVVYRREARLSPSLRAVVDFAMEIVAEHGDLFAGRRPRADQGR
jgi:DNA-binding transcriptional LysR family regulator